MNGLGDVQVMLGRGGSVKLLKAVMRKSQYSVNGWDIIGRFKVVRLCRDLE